MNLGSALHQQQTKKMIRSDSEWWYVSHPAQLDAFFSGINGGVNDLIFTNLQENSVCQETCKSQASNHFILTPFDFNFVVHCLR